MFRKSLEKRSPYYHWTSSDEWHDHQVWMQENKDKPYKIFTVFRYATVWHPGWNDSKLIHVDEYKMFGITYWKRTKDI